jgi:hypothetical protein
MTEKFLDKNFKLVHDAVCFELSGKTDIRGEISGFIIWEKGERK